jgi:Aminopeptidase N
MVKRILFFVALLSWQLVNAQVEDDFVDKAKTQFSLRDFIGCVETCDQILKINPKREEAYYYKVLSKLFLGDKPGCEAEVLNGKAHGYRVKDKMLRFWTDPKNIRDYCIKNFYKGQKVYPEFDYRPKYTRKDSLRGALRPERTCFDVTFYDLSLKIDPRKKFISGSVGITFNVTEPTKRIQIDLFDRYKIASITWDNKPLRYTREYNAIFVNFPDNLTVGSKQTITVTYSGKPINAPNPPWDGGFVWKKDKNGNYWDGVACEHLGASSWWPNKDHPTDEPDSAKLTFIVPSGYDLVSNGRFLGKTKVDSSYTSHTWFVSNPINNYDITFYLGKFSHFSDTMTNRLGKYPLDYYVLPNNLDEAKKCFAQAKEVLKFYEQAYGEFPFMTDKYCLVESPYEGMEHQSCIAYGNEYNKQSKDQMYLDKKYDYIIVHESAHEWWGNSVTARDMADIWLQEGFATYAEMMFIEHVDGYEAYLKEMQREMDRVFNVWPVVENYNVNENAFASNDCYMKGAAILHNLRSTMENDTLFFKIIKDFALKYRHKITTTTDFISMVNEYTGKNYTPFFRKFLYDKNLPVLKYTYRTVGKDILLKYQWDGVDKGFEMPFGIRISSGKTQRILATSEPQEITLKNCKSFYFYNVFMEPENAPKNGYTYYWTRCDNKE